MLQLVYEQVRHDKHLLDNLLQCLKHLKGEGKKFYDILCKERATGSVEEVGEVQDTERCLTEDDIALAGSIVGVASVADKIPTIKRSPICNRLCEDTSPSVDMPKILFQSMDTQVVYGRSNLLEVEVSYDRSSLSYQWYKDGHKLSDGDNYENTKSSILLVRHSNMTSKHIEGKYVCQVEGGIRCDEIIVEILYLD